MPDDPVATPAAETVEGAVPPARSETDGEAIAAGWSSHAIHVGLFLAIAFLKCPVLFYDSRFWAEEGSVFFASFRDFSFFEAIRYTYLGSFLGLTNLTVWLATLAPLEYAPAVTTTIALAFHTAVAFQIASVARAYRLSLAASLLLVAAWALVPQSYEVWLSATNLQWIAGVSMLFVFALPEPVLATRPILAPVWAAMCGLAGIPGVLVAPFFILRAVEEKSKTLWTIGLVSGACAFVHLLAIWLTAMPGRQYPSDWSVLVLPALLQSVIAPLMTAEFANGLAQAIRRVLPGADGALFGTFVLAAAIIRTAFASSSRSRAASLTTSVAGLWVLVSLIQTFGSLGNPRDLISGLGGARYFLFGSMVLCLFLAWGTTSSDRSLRTQAFALLVVVSLAGVVQRYTSPSIDFTMSGPSFRDQVRACRASAKPVCRVFLWPRSATWYADLKLD